MQLGARQTEDLKVSVRSTVFSPEYTLISEHSSEWVIFFWFSYGNKYSLPGGVMLCATHPPDQGKQSTGNGWHWYCGHSYKHAHVHSAHVTGMFHSWAIRQDLLLTHSCFLNLGGHSAVGSASDWRSESLCSIHGVLRPEYTLISEHSFQWVILLAVLGVVIISPIGSV